MPNTVHVVDVAEPLEFDVFVVCVVVVVAGDVGVTNDISHVNVDAGAGAAPATEVIRPPRNGRFFLLFFFLGGEIFFIFLSVLTD